MATKAGWASVEDCWGEIQVMTRPVRNFQPKVLVTLALGKMVQTGFVAAWVELEQQVLHLVPDVPFPPEVGGPVLPFPFRA